MVDETTLSGSDSIPRTAALRWFAGSYLLLLGMSFLILPRGPINPLHGLVWLRGPFFVLSGLAMLWLCTLRLSRRASVVSHLLAAVPPIAVAAPYIHLHAYAPAVTLFLLGVGIAFSPVAAPRPLSSAWRPDALGFVLGLGLADQGIDLAARPQPGVSASSGASSKSASTISWRARRSSMQYWKQPRYIRHPSVSARLHKPQEWRLDRRKSPC